MIHNTIHRISPGSVKALNHGLKTFISVRKIPKLNKYHVTDLLTKVKSKKVASLQFVGLGYNWRLLSDAVTMLRMDFSIQSLYNPDSRGRPKSNIGVR